MINEKDLPKDHHMHTCMSYTCGYKDCRIQQWRLENNVYDYVRERLAYIKPLLKETCIGSIDDENVWDAGEDFKKSLRKRMEDNPRLKKALEDGKQIDIRLELNHDDNRGLVMITDVYPYE